MKTTTAFRRLYVTRALAEYQYKITGHLEKNIDGATRDFVRRDVFEARMEAIEQRLAHVEQVLEVQ